MDQFRYSKTNRFRFALVGHTEELAGAVERAVNPEIEEMVIRVVRIGEALHTAQKLFDEGVEVILGHMGNSRLMQKATGKLVVNISRSSLDLIKAFEKARKHGTRIGLSRYEKPRDGIPDIERLLGVKIKQIVFKNYEEMEAGLNIAFKDGINSFVGGGVSRKIVHGLGAHHVVPIPRRSVVEEALEEARALARIRRRQLESEERIRTIIQEIDEGILGIDEYGRVDIINKHAKQIFEIDMPEAAQQNYRQCIKKVRLLNVLTDGNPILDKILKINRSKVLVKAFPIKISGHSRGAVALLRDVSSVENMNRKVREELYKKGFVAKHTVADVKGSSKVMRQMMVRAKLFAATDATICIHGETGVGKELIAQAIHNMSSRKNAPFVAINCAALPEQLLESELFGYEEGAFTGAKRGGKVGLFELANTGTIFLDEIGDISKSLQVRLLRVIESKEVMRIGGDKYVPVDIRILSASHKDLGMEVAQDRFRADLYYRLNILKLGIPPLRDRLQDIPEIIDSLLSKHHKPASAINKRMYKRMHQYPWPGNIRELSSFIESYLILLDKESKDEPFFMELMEEIDMTGMKEQICRTDTMETQGKAEMPAIIPTGDFCPKLKDMVETYEYRVIENTLKTCKFNRAEAAKQLGISANTLWRKYNQKTSTREI